MRPNTSTIVAATLLVLLAVACKRNQPAEPDSVAEDHAATASAEEAEEAQAEQAQAEQAAEQAEADPEAAADDTPPADGARTITAIAVGEGWTMVTSKTPKGATVSFGVPDDWLEAKPPNESTLAVRFAPAESPANGTKATLVATEFKGGRTELADSTRSRLEGFAEIKREGPARVAGLPAYEFAASWSTPVGNMDTAQIVLATGKEAIGVSCVVPPGRLETLSGLCDEIFATVSIKGATARK